MQKDLKDEKITTPPQVFANKEKQSPDRPAGSQTPAAWNLRSAGLLSKDQAQGIRSLHETFARALSNALGAYLRGAFEVALVAVEQIAYPEYVQRVPDPNFVCSLSLQPFEGFGVMELDLQLALPVVDMLLGGKGAPASEVRDVTDIEEEILGSMVQLICDELEATWRPLLQLDLRFLHRQKKAQIRRLMSPREKILSLSLEIRTAEVRGMLNLAFPAVVVNALLRKLEEQDLYRENKGESSNNRHLRTVLERCCFHAELLLPEIPIPAGKLVRLKVGEVLEFPLKASLPILFKVENQVLFLAHPVATGDRRAAEIHAKAVTSELIKEEPN